VHLSEALPNHIGIQRLEPEEGFHRGERLPGIGGLMGAKERQEDVVDRAISTAEPNELTGYRELVFEPARVMGNREGYVRRFEFTQPGRESLAQTQLYYAEGNRAYTAAATTLAASRRFDLQLHQILREVIIER